MKTYPMEIENCGEETYQLMSKGHHDPVEFMREVQRRYSRFGTMSIPEHVWLKAIPKDGYHAWYVPTTKGTRGAFPATWSSESGDDKDREFYNRVKSQPTEESK